MSGTLFDLGSLLGFNDWKSQLKPASFRGVPFYVDGHDQEAGRRIVASEFPFEDQPDTEDLGRRQERYTLEAYVIGDDYFAQASALYKACVLDPNMGDLIHPYLGTIQVRCMNFRRRENKREGRIARVSLTFIEAGASSTPLALVDTASSVLGWVAGALQIAKRLYALAVIVQNHPGFLLGFVTSIVGDLANGMLGLPAGTLQGFAGFVSGIGQNVSDPVATGTAIAGAFAAYADGVAANTATFPSEADPSYGLTKFAAFGAIYPAVPLTTPDRIQQAANQTAAVLFVQTCAALATARLYAQTPWNSSTAALAARDQLTGWLDTLATSAADAGFADLYVALSATLTAVTADMTSRAQQLPALGTYRTPDTMPSLVLAWQLYQDPTRATELAALNDAPHPGFMPIAGLALTR